MVQRTLIIFIAICAGCLAQTNVLTQHNDVGRTGQNLTETVLTPAAVSSGNFGKLYAIPLDGQAYAQPLYMSSVQIGGVNHSVLFVATEHDSVYALDVNANGAVLWMASLLDSAHGAAAGATPDPVSDTGCQDVQGPEYGITGTPVIDSSSGTLYVVSKTFEGTYPVQRMHALDITSGAEKFNGPVTIKSTTPGTGIGTSGGSLSFDPKWENQKPALLLLDGTVYAAWGAHCDFSPWHGWVMGYSATSGTLTQTASFNTTPNGSAGGVWMSGAGLSADSSNGNSRLFAVSGNGSYDSLGDWGDSVLNMSVKNGLTVTDSFTPYNQNTMNIEDLDLGSSTFLILPDQPGTYPHLGVVISKQGQLYLLNRDNLGGYATGVNNIVQQVNIATAGYGLLGVPAYFNGSIYFWPFDGNLSQYSISNGVFSTAPVSISKQSEASSYGYFLGATPSISANGSTNGIVWVDDWVGDPLAPAQFLYAFDATDVSKTLWSSSANAARDGAGPIQKFSVPTVADGRVFLPAKDQIMVYGLFGNSSSSSVDFGSTVAAAPVGETVTFTPLVTGATVTGIQVLTDGTAGGDFVLSSAGSCNSVGASTPCTIALLFTPKLAGLRKGAVVLTDSSGRTTTIYVHGIGAMPEIYSTGIQTTFSAGQSQPSGVTVDSAGNVYIANAGSGSVTELNAGGTLVRNISGLGSPDGVALDGAGNLYVAEAARGDVVKVLPGATSFTTFISGLSLTVQGLATDGAGNLYVADAGNNVVLEVSPAGMVSPVAIGSLTLLKPTGVALDAAGDLFISDSGNGRVVEVPVSGAANAQSYASGFQTPQSVAVDASGNVFVADAAAQVIDELPGMTIGAGFTLPYAVAVGPGGDLYVDDRSSGQIVKIKRAQAPPVAAQTITFNSIATQTVYTNLALVVSSSSGLAVSYSSSTPGVCTVSGATVSLIANGTCTIVASQAGNSIYGAATSVSQTFSVVLSSLPAPNVGYLAFWGVNNSGVTISWSTDVPANTALAYGTSAALGTLTPIQTAMTNSHGVVLTGLSTGTTYYFVAQSTGANGATGFSATYSFTTTGPAAVPLPPVISNVIASSLTSSSVIITWTTDQATSSQVTYGPTTSYGSSSPLSTSLTTSHSVMLTGLMPGTTYDYEPASTNSTGTSGTSSNYTFTTTSLTSGPQISAITVTGLTSISATINWTTDQPSMSLVTYGTTIAYGSSSTLAAAYVTNHSVTLTGLTPGTSYDYVVVSADSVGLSTTSVNNILLTPSLPVAAVISNITVTGLTSTSATITWTTDQASTSLVNYGTTTAYLLSSMPNAAYVTSHSVTLTGLTAGTTYDYAVVSANSAGLSATSANLTFTTPVSTGTPPYVGYLAYWGVNNSGVYISWSTDLLANTQLAYGTTAALGQLTPLQTTLANSHGIVLTGLNSGTTYYFVAQSTAGNGATGYSATYRFTTTGTPSITPVPVISNVAATSITATTAIITWTTDQASSSLVNYGTSSTYGLSSTLSSSGVMNHSVMLTGLTSGSTYNYQVVSATASSTNYTFATPTVAAPSAPVISNVLAMVTNGTATITWTTDQGASSLVNYGNSIAYGSSSSPNAALVTSHTVTLTGLTSGTLFDFDLVSTNASGLSTTSVNGTFSTPSTNATAPNLSYVAYWGITNSGVTISWSTDAPATGVVAYGTTPALGQLSPPTTSLTASHGVTLSGLTGGTTYYFVAQSTGANGATGYSTTYSFTTTGAAALPTISGVSVTPGSNSTAVISWTTSVPTSSYVQFGATTTYGRYSAQTPLTSSPRPAMGYVPSGVVHYQLVSADAYGNQVLSPDYTFVEP